MNQDISKDNFDTQTADGRRLKIAFVCHSDTLGGASVVTHRLLQALCDEGVDARMVVFTKMSDDKNVERVECGRFRRGTSFLSERGRIALANGFSRENMFKVSIASNGLDISDLETIKDADVIVLSWINQGLLSLKGIEKLGKMGKPIVWIMHDMWNITGICHHAYECQGYVGQCGSCQFLKGTNPTDLSHRIWLKKKRLYDEIPITFVAVSNWLADCCRHSELMQGRDVRVIHNAFPISSFHIEPRFVLNTIPLDNKLILMGAARLDDPIKGLGMAIEALNYLFDNKPEVSRNVMAVFFGSFRNHNALENLRFPYYSYGVIHDGKILREIYAHASVVISTSLYETLPGTLIEGQAAGCLPVTFGSGGQADIVEHKKTGYIARYKDVEDFAEGIAWALSQDVDREALHEHVRKRFSAKIVAGQFIDLFNELLER